MKKRCSSIISMILVLFVLCITGCSEETYSVDYSGQKQDYDNAEESYAAGEEVTLYYKMIASDTDHVFYLDGKPLTAEYDDSKGFIICFTMPAREVKLECVKINTFSGEVNPKILAFQKQQYGLYEWDETTLLVRSEFSHVTISEQDGAEFPQLAKELEQTAAMLKKSMEEEYDNICSFVKEDGGGEQDATSVSSQDIQLRRADSVAVSLLADSYADFGWIEGVRGMIGTTYDAQTGRELKLSDVIIDMEKIPVLVEQELNSHMWAGDFSYDGVVADYFQNTPEDGISWTLDYNGVTFYFEEGSLATEGNGRQTATVSFAQYPEVFDEKYMTVPDAYMTELPWDNSFFADLDDDGDLEELNFTAVYDSDVGSYSSFGIYTDTDGYYHYEEFYADDFIPYYVKTESGSHFMYLFCEQGEGFGPRFVLKVFDIYGGRLTEVDVLNMGLSYSSENVFHVPTDPNQMVLDDYDAELQAAVYTTGPTGLPVLK